MSRVRPVLILTGLMTLSIGSPLVLGTTAAHATTSTSSSGTVVRADPSTLTYTVKSGDYLSGIARVLGVRLSDLLTANAITIDTVIYPGRNLVVPVGGTLPSSTNQSAPALDYVVARGDYLTAIAHKLGVTLPSLLAANSIAATALIRPGDKLKVPAGGALPVPTDAPATAAAATGTTYVVQAGDYLIGIAAKNGVTLKALLAANTMVVTSAIYPGKQLTVPPATLPVPAAVTSPTAESENVAAASIAPVIDFLKAQVGKAYAFNSEGPDTYDCSGLVRAAYLQIGIKLPHQSLLQSQKGTAVDWRTDDLKPGDLVFQYSTANPTVISHVGIAIDSTTWIQAARSGVPIKIGPLPADDKIVSVRRIVSG